MRKIGLTGFFVAFFVANATSAFALDTEAIAQRNMGAAVVIWASDSSGGRELQGSGCCVDTSGYVLTVAHQVVGLDTFRARLADGTQFSLQLVDVDESRELALLKSATPLPQAVTIGDARQLVGGSPILAIASPIGLEFSTVPGTVSSTNRQLRGHPIIQAVLQASPGSSGGPVFDKTGALIGMIVSRLEQEASIKMVAPINNAYALLRKYGIRIGGRVFSTPGALEIIPAKNVTHGELRAIQAYNRGVLAKSVGEKVSAYQQVVKELPLFFEAWFNLGVAFTVVKDMPQAAEAYRAAERLRPGEVKVHRNLGRVLLRQQAFSDAQASFEKALALASNDPSSHNDLGYVFLQQQKLAKAEQYFATALKMRPDYAAARYNLALTYAVADEKAAAIKQFEEYLRLIPNASDASEVRAMIEKLRKG